MIVGRDDEIEGQYVGTRFVGLVVPAGTYFVAGKLHIPIRPTSRTMLLALGRVWLPVVAIVWPPLLGWRIEGFIETALMLGLCAALHRSVHRVPEEVQKQLKLLGTQTGLRINPSRLLDATRTAKTQMLEDLLNKAGLAPDPAWLVEVLPEIPPPALPLVYAYARYASDEPPWSTCAEVIYAEIERGEAERDEL